MNENSEGPMARDQLPADCFSYRGKLKVRTALRYLYSTRDWAPSDARLCDLWGTNDDPVFPKRIGRERSSLAGASGEGFRLAKAGQGKWRVIERPHVKGNGPGVTDLFDYSKDDDGGTHTTVFLADPDGAPGWFKPYAVMIERIYNDLVG